MLELCMIPGIHEAGCDEAGRGCLCGSVFAAAVILPQDPKLIDPELLAHLNDSKQLTEKQRYALRPLIERDAVAWAVAETSAQEIDRINILKASILAMHRALDQLDVRPQHILVDGNRFRPYVPENELLCIEHHTVVKGDGKYLSIAAASILAKTYRDDYMMQLHQQYPQYAWDKNKGYPTADHRRAIAQYGLTPEHRLTFRALPKS